MTAHRFQWVRRPVWTAGVAVLLATALPLVPTDAGWVRIFDFPRLQFAVLSAIVLVGALLLLDLHRQRVRVFATALLLALGYQAFHILPFTPVVRVQAPAVEACREPSRVRLLVANVLEDNRRSEPLLAMVQETQSDLALLLETDGWWDGRLAALERDYPFSVRQPQENTYGMHFLSRLELIAPDVRFLIEEAVPSIATGVRLRSGATISFYGLHPKPPRLFQGTAPRDAELLHVAREVAATSTPAIVAGDMNDVAWSRTNQHFQAVSGLLDPRVGRGLYSTYHANRPLLRWPLDHIFFETSFKVQVLRRMGHVGSDHFPVFISLCHVEAATAAGA